MHRHIEVAVGASALAARRRGVGRVHRAFERLDLHTVEDVQEISEVLANSVTALSVDPESGELWAATARYDKRKPNRLIRYDLGTSLQTDFAIPQTA
jgi:hypothetical protein